MTRLAARILDIADTAGLAADRVDAMYALYAAHYAACDRRRFGADLAAKDHVILLEDQGCLAGFSTVALFRHRTFAGPVQVLFSGDTVIDRSAWGEQVLSRSFAQLAGRLHARDRATPLYWLLISKGHRTYRYLKLFAHRFHPHPAGRDAMLERLAAEIAVARFGRDFDPVRGVIAFPQSRGHLRAELAQVPARIAARPEGAFFLQRNPGYEHGDELVCLAELRPDNLRAAVRTAFLAGMTDGLA
jgi:hypothetical protein